MNIECPQRSPYKLISKKRKIIKFSKQFGFNKFYYQLRIYTKALHIMVNALELSLIIWNKSLSAIKVNGTETNVIVFATCLNSKQEFFPFRDLWKLSTLQSTYVHVC